MANKKKLFAKIYDQYIDRIYRFIFFKIGSQETAEDLCSETFLKGWQAFKQNNAEIENPQAFLYKIAKNLIVDHYREKGKAQLVSTDVGQVLIRDSGIDLEKQSLQKSDLETIRTGLVGLKDEYQEIIILHYINDLSIPEIAKTINKTEGAARVQLHRAVKALKSCVKQG